MNHDELKQDLIDAYDALEVDLETTERATRAIIKDQERVEECKRSLEAYEKEHQLV